MKKFALNLTKKFAAPTALLLVASSAAVAGGGGGATPDTTFDSIYTTNAAGIMRQSAMAVVLGLAFALIFAYGPTIIDNIFSLSI
jgi:hypothetical protein